MPQGPIGEELRALRAKRGNRTPPMMGFEMPEDSGEGMPDEQGVQPVDRALNSLPEVAGLVSQLVPQGKLPKLLMQLFRIAMPAGGEAIRQTITGEEPSLEKVATRTAANAMPMVGGKAAKATAEAGGKMLTRQAISRGVKGATPDIDDLATGGAGLKPGADVTKMTTAMGREGTKLTVGDAQKYAKWAKELEFIKSRNLNSSAQAAYLRARPEVAAALQRSGGDVQKAIDEFKGLAETVIKTSEGASRQGFNIPRFLAGAGVGGMVDYATGMPGIGTGVGLGLGSLEASVPLKFGVGRGLQTFGNNPHSDDYIEAAMRATGAATTAATAEPRRRRLER